MSASFLHSWEVLEINRHSRPAPSVGRWQPVYTGGGGQGQHVPLRVPPRLQGIAGSQPEVGGADADLWRATVNQERRREGVHGASGQPLE